MLKVTDLIPENPLEREREEMDPSLPQMSAT